MFRIISPSDEDFRISPEAGNEVPPRYGLSVRDRLALKVEIGAAGPPGPPGAGGDSYTHTQASPASLWTINHNLARSPASVTAYTTGGVEIEGSVLVVNANQVTIEFSTALAGSARII